MDQLSNLSFVFWDEINKKVIIINKPDGYFEYFNGLKPDESFAIKLKPYFNMPCVEIDTNDFIDKYGIFELVHPFDRNLDTVCFKAIGFDWKFTKLKKEELPEEFKTHLLLMGID